MQLFQPAGTPQRLATSPARKYSGNPATTPPAGKAFSNPARVMAQSSIRRLKVACHFRQLHPHLSTTAKLTLQGDWLAAAGFPPGAVALVEVQAGRLTITPSC